MASREDNILLEFIEHPWFSLFYSKRVDMSMKWIQARLNDPDSWRTHEQDIADKQLMKTLNKIRQYPLGILTSVGLNENEAFMEYAELTKQEKKK